MEDKKPRLSMIHKSLEPKTDPEIFESILEITQNMRDNKCVGFVFVAIMEHDDQIQVEWLRHIDDDEDPRFALDGIVAVGQEILEDYEIEDFKPGESFD